MDKINLLIIVTVISLFISLFLAFFVISVKTEHKLSNRLFSVFLILSSIDMSGILFDFIIEGPSNIGMFRNSIAFLPLPVFYLYALSVCYYDFKLKAKHLLHLIPFLLANLILLPRFYLIDLSSKIKFLENRSSMLEIQCIHIFFHIQILAYITAVFLILRKARKIYLENYAGASITSLKWLFELTLALSIFYFIAFIKNIFKFSDYPYVSEWVQIGLFVVQLLIISWYLFKALNNPGLFRNIDSKLKLVSDIILENKNIELQSLNKKEYNSEIIKLKNYMIDKKPFLNPYVTIQEISKDLKIPTRELSVLINHTLGQHFFDFVNTYRIENAKKILKDHAKSKETILEILYEVGFNSKSSFNTAFKKHTGFTPTEYRKTLDNSTL